MNRKKNVETISPSPSAYHISKPEPQALDREISTVNQTRFDTDTIKWGDDDAFPLRIIDAINQSPTASSCIGTTETFIRGNGFSSEELMNLIIDKDGTTLYQLHCQLSQYLSILDGFSVCFKFDSQGKITNTYLVNLETVRFKRPIDGENNKVIDVVKINPYFGTLEYQQRYTEEYPLWNPLALKDQIQKEGTQFRGQVYFYGGIRPPYKFYPVPKYWAGQQWIYVDAQIQQFHKKNLDNGFFQSVLMTQIGDPNQMSKNPKYQSTITESDGVTKTIRSTKTVGEEFNEDMSRSFSGVDKAGAVFNLWAKNSVDAPKLQSFPVNSQFDVLAGTFTDAIRGITIATEVPAILANLPQQNSSLGSDGNAMNMAVQLMQSRVSGKKRILEDFYNNILLPNLQTPIKEKVQILDYSPISSTIDYYNFHAFELYWAFMQDKEKADFITTNISEIKLDRPPIPAGVMTPTQPINPIPGQTLTPPTQVDEVLKGMKISEINRIMSIVNKVKNGKLTDLLAKQLLTGYGLNEDQIATWLNPQEENETTYPFSISK